MSQQLEVNHHRIQRILDFVRDAGREPAKRRQLARVANRGLHLAQVAEVASDEHHGDEVAGRIVNRVRHDQPLTPFAARVGKGRRDRAARPAADERLLGQPAKRMVRRHQILERGPGCGLWQQRAHGRIGEQQLAARIDDRHGVLELLDRGLEIGHLAGHLRAISRQLGADRVEERTELPELVVLTQIESNTELAAAEARQPTADDMNGPEQKLREQHRAQDRDGERGTGRDDRRPQRRIEILPDEECRDADPNRSEIGVRQSERLPEFEVLSLP
jgi:hypothetical protein